MALRGFARATKRLYLAHASDRALRAVALRLFGSYDDQRLGRFADTPVRAVTLTSAS